MQSKAGPLTNCGTADKHVADSERAHTYSHTFMQGRPQAGLANARSRQRERLWFSDGAMDRTTFNCRGKTIQSMMKVIIQPRLQIEKFSLYWREPLQTETQSLPPLELELEVGAADAATVQELLAQAAAKLGWQAVGTLQRLEGFKEPWERCIWRGGPNREYHTVLAEAGLALSSCFRAWLKHKF